MARFVAASTTGNANPRTRHRQHDAKYSGAIKRPFKAAREEVESAALSGSGCCATYDP